MDNEEGNINQFRLILPSKLYCPLDQYLRVNLNLSISFCTYCTVTANNLICFIFCATLLFLCTQLRSFVFYFFCIYTYLIIKYYSLYIIIVRTSYYYDSNFLIYLTFGHINLWYFFVDTGLVFLRYGTLLLL